MTYCHNVIAATAIMSIVIGACSGIARADVNVMSSGGFAEAFKAGAPVCEVKIGQKIVMAFGNSMGPEPSAIPNRLARGEPADMVIIAAASMDELITSGQVKAESRVDLAQSLLGVAVRQGANKPKIGTMEELKETLLAAKSIAISSGHAGIFLMEKVFPGIDEDGQIAGKAKKVVGEPVGAAIARGDFEIGFQNVSELLPVEGIEVVGAVPAGAQPVSIFSAGIAAKADNAEGAAELIACLGSAEIAPIVAKAGLRQLPAR